MANQQESPKKAISIRTQVIIVIGLIQILGLAIAIISYMSLQNYQRNVNTRLSDANKAQDLSSDIQTEFLLARQNEAAFLIEWRLNGISSNVEEYISSNRNHIAQANAVLSQLESLLASSSDPGLQSIKDETINLRPQLNEYSEAFDATVELVRNRAEPGGLDSTLKAVNERLIEGLLPLEDSTYLQTAYLMQQGQQNYFSTRRQEYIDTFHIQNAKLMNMLDNTSQEDIQGSALTIPQMKYLVDDQYKFFNQLVGLEQNIEINSAIFQETSVNINQTISSVSQKSVSGASLVASEMASQGRNASLAILIAAVTASVVGLTAGIIHTINLVGPIRRLTRAANEMRSGKLNERVSVRGPSEINQLAENFNKMAERLSDTLSGLEDRVEERTQALARRSTQLQASAEVARNATSLRDLDVLLNQTANLIRDRFGFYHAGIFLVDPKREYAILRAATGDAGREMLDRKHRLKVGETGIVGRVCATGDPLISLDVGSEAVHFRNPLLPETRSEMALPLRSGRQVIGAIDVQSNAPSAFDEQDIAVLQSMADQLAVAIENARLFAESQENIQQLQAIYGTYNKQAWENLSKSRQLIGYSYEAGEITLLEEHPDSEAPISLPLTVRGQVIGNLDIWPSEVGLSESEKNILNTLGDRIGQAMESARLYEEAQSRATREQSLSQLTAMFTRSLSFDTILKTAVQELGRMPNVSEASIQLDMPTQEE